MGGLFQTSFRRTCEVAGLPEPLHPSRGTHQQPADRLSPRTGAADFSRPARRRSTQGHDAACRKVDWAILAARIAFEADADSALWLSGQPLQTCAAGNDPQTDRSHGSLAFQSDISWMGHKWLRLLLGDAPVVAS